MFARPIRLADGEIFEFGDARVRLKVSARARRVSLRVDRASGEVLAIAPSPRRLVEAAAFAQARRAWVAARTAEQGARRRFSPGMELVLFGEPCRLGLAPGRASLEGPAWERGVRMPADAEPERFGRAALHLIKAQARAWFTPRLVRHCQALGVAPARVSISGPRTRWGSCTQGDGRRAPSIRLSWRLALAPPEVANYVAAHEAAHLLEANHSSRFWAQVGRLVGDPAPHRAWLRAHGAALHALEG